MKNFGGLLFVFGVLAIVLDFINYVPRLLFWIYNWGDGVAWLIKIAMVVAGGALYLMAKRGKEEVKETEV